MTHDLTVLTITAASLGLFHTLFGPDHYLPFIMMARARRWEGRKRPGGGMCVPVPRPEGLGYG